ncbi:Verru_Chthon cassette protein C [Roseimicrobium gellanilyticum]|nr:Verru_Chthon cassette protein C [Roseimicrobium gellanilyticum]
MNAPPGSSRRVVTMRGFTLVELLVSMTVLSVLMIFLAQVLSDTQRTWGQARARVGEFRESRAAFEAIARRLSQVTLNSYWGYKLDSNGTPTLYHRQSELHYVSGPAAALLPDAQHTAGHAVFFQAPLGETLDTSATASSSSLENLLNGWGWYAQYESDLPRRPDFLGPDVAHPEKKRFRLMEFRQPTEKLALYGVVPDPKGGSMPVPWVEAQTGRDALYQWFRDSLEVDSQPVAENVLAVLIQPVWPATTGKTGASIDAAANYLYDTRRYQWPETSTEAIHSRHQLPPVLRLTLIALDEREWSAFDTAKADALALELTGLVNNTLFQKSADYEQDLQRLEAELGQRKLSFRVFSTAVQIPAAKLTSSLED